MPPAWLATASLPVAPIAAGTPLFRIHRRGHGPICFGPSKGQPATYRFDSLTGAFGVLYVGLSFAAAVVETVLRNPSRRIVNYHDLAERASCQLVSTLDLGVVGLHGTGLQAVGCDNSISTGPYDVCGAWADALWAHPDVPDGIAYQSRHDPGQICLALFGRPDLHLQAPESVPLIEQMPTISAILGGYRKSIIGAPV